MHWPNIHVVFSPEKNFQELQLRQALIYFSLNFGTCQDHNILDKSVSAIFQKMFGFNSICVLVFFLKYAMTSVLKNPKVYVNTHYFVNRGHTFLPYSINLLGWKFKSNSIKIFELELVKVKVTFQRKNYSLVHLLQWEYNKKIRVKRSRNVKNICFIKIMLSRKEGFARKKCSKYVIST